MRQTFIRTIALLFAAVLMTGCATKLKNRNAALTQENQQLRDQLADRNVALDSLNQELRDRDMALSQMQRDMDALGTMEAGATGFEGIAGVTGTIGAGEVTAVVESDVLFDSGKASVKNAARQSLDAVASVLNSSYGGKTIRISGYTDTDPIRKSGHKSNYHLGFERAFAVREYLSSRGIESSRMYVASFGPDQPRSSKAESRRVEITVSMN